MKIIAIKKMSAGNETVGDMWTETKIFEPTQTLMEVMDFIKDQFGHYTNKDIVLTIAHEEAKGL